MKVLISGICGFVGSILARGLLDNVAGRKIIGLDNLSRAGSELNLEPLRKRGVVLRHADLRCPSDLEGLPAVDWIIDAAANPSVLAGVDGATSSRQLLEHNLYGTINLLELAKRCRAGFTLLSTSRVYSVKALSEIPVVADENDAFAPDLAIPLPEGVSANGIAENFRRPRRYRSTARRRSHRRRSLWNTAKPSTSRSGLIVAACSLARASSATLSRGFFLIGSMPTCGGSH